MIKGIVAGVLVIVATGCRGATRTLEPGDASHRISVLVAQRFDIVLQTIGPGEYASPPSISPAIVELLDVVPDGSPNPGGPRQRFRFRAMAPGQAIIAFTHTGFNSPVADTVVIH